MGECADCYDSVEMAALKRIARRRMDKENRGPGTDCTDCLAYDTYLQEAIDEFIVMNGRPPKRTCFD